MTSNKPKKMDFEKAMSEIGGIVTAMEQGQVSLEESLQLFEKGVALIRNCQSALQTAEQRVQILMQDHNNNNDSHDPDNNE